MLTPDTRALLPTLRPVRPALYDRPVPDRLRGVTSDGWDGPGDEQEGGG